MLDGLGRHACSPFGNDAPSRTEWRLPKIWKIFDKKPERRRVGRRAPIGSSIERNRFGQQDVWVLALSSLASTYSIISKNLSIMLVSDW